MGSYLRLTVVLAVISAVAGGLLALVNSFTEPKILAYRTLAENKAYRDVLPGADKFETYPSDALARLRKQPETAGIEDVKVGIKDGQPVGWICKVASHGYSSDIKMLVGIGKEAGLGGVKVMEQSETPGLGTKITEPKFIGQKAIQKADSHQDLAVNKDGGTVQAIAGATISSRAVVRGINQAFCFFRGQTGQASKTGRAPAATPETKPDAVTDGTSRKPGVKKR